MEHLPNNQLDEAIANVYANSCDKQHNSKFREMICSSVSITHHGEKALFGRTKIHATTKINLIWKKRD
jgi:hypothetical protein